ncbi:hypothetical protein FRX31_004701, partial [Thalictrum thalictroides]
MSDVVLMLQKKIPVDPPPYPFHFRQSLDSSVLPVIPEVIPKVSLEVSPTIDERQSLDSSVLPPTPEVIPEVRLEVSPIIDERQLIKAGIVNPPMLPPPRELLLEVHSKGSVTVDDSLLVKTGGSSSYISRKVGKIFGNEKGLSKLFRSKQTGSEGSVFFFDQNLQTGSEGSVFFFDQNLQFELKDLLRATAEALGSGDFGRTYKQ